MNKDDPARMVFWAAAFIAFGCVKFLRSDKGGNMEEIIVAQDAAELADCAVVELDRRF